MYVIFKKKKQFFGFGHLWGNQKINFYSIKSQRFGQIYQDPEVGSRNVVILIKNVY